MANGAPLPGELVQVKAEGLEVKAASGSRVINWEMLSLATRYRHQPAFRAGFAAVMKGEPLPAYEPPPEPPPAEVEPPAKKPRRTRKKKAESE